MKINVNVYTTETSLRNEPVDIVPVIVGGAADNSNSYYKIKK
jgi:hypothetical protein